MPNEKFQAIQEKLMTLDTSSKVSNKKGDDGRESLKYISWSDAWGDILKVYPEANYSIKEWNGLPYLSTKEGIMVQTSVTIEGMTRSMWLPVMDTKNKAMKDEPYEYETKYGTKSVAAATMTDVNRTLMRCLVKNLAMFGYGLNVYQGEDFPDVDELEFIKPKTTCADCGSVIEDVKLQNGSIKSAEDIIRNSTNMFGKPLCAKCIVGHTHKSEPKPQTDETKKGE